MKQWSECLCGNYVLSYKNCQSTVPENTVPWLFLITASCAEVYFLLYLMSHPITIGSINARMPALRLAFRIVMIIMTGISRSLL